MATINNGYRIRLNTSLGKQVLDGDDPPPGVTRLEYAVYCLLSAMEVLGEYVEGKEADDGTTLRTR